MFLRELSSITNLNGLSNLTQPALSNWVEIINNSSLVSLNGLSASNINFNNRHLILNNNNALNDISSLSGIQLNNINGLTITNNGQLATCASTWLCGYIATSKPLTVSGNAIGCESVVAVNSACTALSTSDFDFNEISFYPNPTNSVFNLEIPNEVVKQVEIYDLSGKNY